MIQQKQSEDIYKLIEFFNLNEIIIREYGKAHLQQI